MRKSILPIISLSAAVSAVACSSYEPNVALSKEQPKKNAVTAVYAVKADVFIPSNAFACAAVVKVTTPTESKTNANGTDGLPVDDVKATVTVPSELFVKASSDLVVGKVVALTGKVGNPSNVAGLSFKIDRISTSGTTTVLNVTLVGTNKSFDTMQYTADVDVGTTTKPVAECTPQGAYIPPEERAKAATGGTSDDKTAASGDKNTVTTSGEKAGATAGPDDPAMPRSASIESEVDGRSGPAEELPVTTVEPRPFKDRPGLHFEIPPKNLFNFEKTVTADNGDALEGSLRADLLAAYIDVVGRFVVDGRAWVPKVRAGYLAEMDAKILLGLALKLAAKGKNGAVNFTKDLAPRIIPINIGIGTIELKQSFVISCQAKGSAELNLKVGAYARGEAFAGLAATVEPKFALPPWTLGIAPEYTLKVEAGPIFEVTTQGDFAGTCSAELKYKINTWGTADSFLAASAYVKGDPQGAKCPLYGGLRANYSVNLPVVPTIDGEIFSIESAPGGGKCVNQNASDACGNKADGNYCDPTDTTHAFLCSGGKQNGQGQYCTDTSQACKSFDGAGKIVCK